jgi:FkbM family methyltransferase
MSVTDIMTVRFGEITFDLHHDPAYIPDAIIHQCSTSELEPELSAFFLRAARPGDSVVDAGANVGLFTMLLSRLVGPTGFVHAFEPHPDTAARLDRNVALNRTTNVLVHEMALWDTRLDLTLYTCFEPGLASLRPYDGWTGSRTVRTERLDRILNHAPRLIKMDIEGSELTALKGCEKWLGDVPYVACELSRDNLGHHGTTPELVAAYMASYGKDLWFLDKDGKMPDMIQRGGQWPKAAVNQMGLFATREVVEELWR